MQNLGEEICGEFLKNIYKCDFISYNVNHPDIQGEMDVIGISLNNRTIYVCECATHTQGLRYSTNGSPDNYNRLKSKFDKGVVYAKKYFPEYNNIVAMFWSPIVKVTSGNAKYNPMNELIMLKEIVAKEHQIELELVINHSYQRCLDKLKDVASKETSAYSSNIMRIFQIESKLAKHLSALDKKSPNRDVP